MVGLEHLVAMVLAHPVGMAQIQYFQLLHQTAVAEAVLTLTTTGVLAALAAAAVLIQELAEQEPLGMEIMVEMGRNTIPAVVVAVVAGVLVQSVQMLWPVAEEVLVTAALDCNLTLMATTTITLAAAVVELFRPGPQALVMAVLVVVVVAAWLQVVRMSTVLAVEAPEILEQMVAVEPARILVVGQAEQILAVVVAALAHIKPLVETAAPAS